MRILKILTLGLAGLFVLAVSVLLLTPGLHLSSLVMILNVANGWAAETSSEELMERLQLEEGYHLSIFAQGIANPRMLHLAGPGRVLVSSPRSGEVLQLMDSDGDGFADSREVLLNGLTRPHGLDRHEGYLYVAESNRIGRIGYSASQGEVTGGYEVVVDGLGDNGNHWSKTLRFDTDGWMYVAMGSTCNVCEEEDNRRAAIMRYRADGSEGSIYATGLRNSVGMDFAPWDGALYATDNGRDMLGDDYPPCELNLIEESGFYGWPWLNGDNDPDPDFPPGGRVLPPGITPLFSFKPHNAPLGIHFSTTQERTALVALHGSWNRTTPDGFKVVSLYWDQAGGISSSDFLWGFEQDGDIAGRPVDISADGEGGYFISDDYARLIYRVSRKQPTGPGPVPAGPTSPAQTVAPAPQIDSAMALAGEQLYRELACAGCHGLHSPTPVPLDGLASRFDLDSLAGYFLTPTPPMPRYELSEDQRRELAHFLLTEEAE